MNRSENISQKRIIVRKNCNDFLSGRGSCPIRSFLSTLHSWRRTKVENIDSDLGRLLVEELIKPKKTETFLHVYSSSS